MRSMMSRSINETPIRRASQHAPASQQRRSSLKVDRRKLLWHHWTRLVVPEVEDVDDRRLGLVLGGGSEGLRGRSRITESA